MKPIAKLMSYSVHSLVFASISIVLCQPVPLHAAPDVARVAGDLKVDGIHFSADDNVIRRLSDLSSPWTISNTNIYFTTPGGKVGIGKISPSTELDVNGTVTATQFSGDGAGLANLWKTTGNAGTTPGINFVGTTDNQALEIRVNNTRAIRIEPNAGTPNIMSGNSSNVATGGGATVSGGGLSGTLCMEPSTGLTNRSCGNQAINLYATIGGGVSNNASGGSSTVGGGSANTASGSSSTIAGGGSNIASAYDSTVGGGGINRVIGNYGTVAGGYTNTASGQWSTVGGGWSNTAGKDFSTVGGGYLNTASGYASMVAGGLTNQAGGDYSFAGGYQAKVRDAVDAGNATGDQGTFIWADALGTPFQSTGQNQFLVRAAGGVGINTNAPTSGTALDVFGNARVSGPLTVGDLGGNWNLDLTEGDFKVGDATYRLKIGVARAGGGKGDAWVKVDGGSNHLYLVASGGTTIFSDTAHTAGVSLAAGGGSWSTLSDRSMKQDIEEINGDAILAKVAALPVYSWRYKEEVSRALHVGPIAQDFYAAFGLGDSDKTITTVDADGIALAAIKGLKAENDALKADNNAMKLRLDKLEKALFGQ